MKDPKSDSAKLGHDFGIGTEKKRNGQMERKVYFVGAGPGNPKLITVLGREMLEKADLVIYAGSLVNPEILNYTKGKTVDSYGLTLEETTKMIADAVDLEKVVVRLHSGDPSLYGAIIEQMEELKKYDIRVERISGVSSVFASAVALGTQLTLNKGNYGKSPMPERYACCINLSCILGRRESYHRDSRRYRRKGGGCRDYAISNDYHRWSC